MSLRTHLTLFSFRDLILDSVKETAYKQGRATGSGIADPVAGAPVGTSKQNLQFAIEGETSGNEKLYRDVAWIARARAWRPSPSGPSK